MLNNIKIDNDLADNLIEWNKKWGLKDTRQTYHCNTNYEIVKKEYIKELRFK